MCAASSSSSTVNNASQLQSLQELTRTVREDILSLTTKLGELENDRTEHKFLLVIC